MIAFLGDSCNAFEIFGGLPRLFLTWGCLFIDSIGSSLIISSIFGDVIGSSWVYLSNFGDVIGS